MTARLAGWITYQLLSSRPTETRTDLYIPDPRVVCYPTAPKYSEIVPVSWGSERLGYFLTGVRDDAKDNYVGV